MNQTDQQQAFHDDIAAVIDRYRQEFDLSLSSAVGVLHILAHRLVAEALNEEDDEQE